MSFKQFLGVCVVTVSLIFATYTVIDLLLDLMIKTEAISLAKNQIADNIHNNSADVDLWLLYLKDETVLIISTANADSYIKKYALDIVIIVGTKKTGEPIVLIKDNQVIKNPKEA